MLFHTMLRRIPFVGFYKRLHLIISCQPTFILSHRTNSYCYIPSLSLFERVPLGNTACSVIDFVASLVEEGLKKGIIFQCHTQDVQIDSLLSFSYYKIPVTPYLYVAFFIPKFEYLIGKSETYIFYCF